MTRREAICGLGAGLVAAPSLVAGRKPSPGTIDVHHHLAPPAQISALDPAGIAVPALMKSWSIQKTMAELDRAGIDRAILSITVPGLGFVDQRAIPLARACNDYAVGLVATNRARLGFFAALPLPDGRASVAEARRALDELGADGVLLFTNIAGRYLGDAVFAPLLDYLDERGTTVFVHPTGNACCQNIVPELPETLVEYGTDTTRTIASLMFAPGARPRKRLRWIFSHAGGTLPSLTERFIGFASQRGIAMPASFVSDALKAYHYDTAQAANPVNLKALSLLVPTENVIFGSDYPFRGVAEQVQQLRRCGLSASDLDTILRCRAWLGAPI